MRTWTFRLPLWVFLSAILLTLLLAISLPKFILLDLLITRSGLFLTADRVREGIGSLTLEGVKVLAGGEELLRLDSFLLKLGADGLSVLGYCGEGLLELRRSWLNSLRLRAEDFPCVRDVSRLEANLRLGKGLRGTLTLEDAKVRGILLERVRLNFEGERFTGTVVSGGVELKGRGRIRVNPLNPLESYVEGTFRSQGLTLLVRGKIPKLSLKLR
jgi:hypothetical protein